MVGKIITQRDVELPIYIIESIPKLRQDLEKALCREHQVLVCSDPEQALNRATDDFIDMVAILKGT